ncbi:hypothetical protein A2973_00505 [Candidatus Gottesmanbacteria bacterium RIFCSPLOWO2_01_FULL_49_10]|uniref:Glycosyl transferase family 1 domain-containing protein n=1 Tax=Candidatus Gottesmanbacteria bacterium RIFCSPLOWO2_01_FULL_49_10 TaxID=1798396 RepID=A0A1F6AWN6_9BACT|nr:MAG: hypothetical protein A2973_00505 [Candidatus Gottesmanbacteria bacterium RIFCSPLOWO2_01_FULL_49_10]
MIKQPRIAFVYDRVNKWGGAERVLLALHELWPEAPLFTAVYDPDRAGWANVFAVKPSFMQYVPFAKHYHEWFPWLTPMAFESFTFDDYDVVISVTSAEAKFVITKPHTLHICYCLTPTRYLWSEEETYRTTPGLGSAEPVARRVFPAMLPMLKRWDAIGSSRPDYYIAISERVKARIEKYYGREVAAVIYPPVETEIFEREKANGKRQTGKDDYFLVVSRLVRYKRIDLIVEALNELRLPLVIIGSGYEERLLGERASDTISFVSRHLTDAELGAYYESCRAFISAADEDFGIAAVEAQAAGKPVICYRHSGVSEIVQEGITGMLFSAQTRESLVDALEKFEKMKFTNTACRINAERFSKDIFQKRMKETMKRLVSARAL